MGTRRMFSSVTQLLVSQWTTHLNELMSRSDSSLETNPRISTISFQPPRGCLCYSTDHSNMVLIDPKGNLYAGEDVHPWSSSDDVLRSKYPSCEGYS